MNDSGSSGRTTPDILVHSSSLDVLLMQVKCPVCTGHLMVPITFCTKGHNICNDCRDMMEKCPICEGAFIGTRNVNLENISMWCGYPCPNSGCPITRPSEFMADHLATCMYVTTKCPLTGISNILCPWQGLLKDVQDHVSECHKNNFFIGHSFRSSSVDTSLIALSYEEELFVYHKKVKNGTLYCAIIKLGMTKDLFTANFILDTNSGFERVSVSHLVGNVRESFESIFKSGRALQLCPQIYQRFIKKGKLALNVVLIKGWHNTSAM